MHATTVIHRLSEKDLEARTALCSVCGPTTLRLKGSTNPRCLNSAKLTRRRSVLKSRYGIDWQTWEVLLVMQSGRCAICRDPMRDPHVDHDHETGEVRGLLCAGCNHGLGNFRDNPQLLRVAIDYLAK